jgi:hypothetical protein
MVRAQSDPEWYGRGDNEVRMLMGLGEELDAVIVMSS